MDQPQYAPGERERLQERFTRVFAEEVIRPRRELNVLVLGAESKADLFVVLSAMDKARKANLDITAHIAPAQDAELNRTAARMVGRLGVMLGALAPRILLIDREEVRRAAREAIEILIRDRDLYEVPTLSYIEVSDIEPKAEQVQTLRKERHQFRQFQNNSHKGRPDQRRQHAMIRPPRRGGR